MNRREVSVLREYASRAVTLFTVCVGVIVSIYLSRDGMFHFDNSISFYMGREVWSAVIFGLCNIVVAYNWWKCISSAREYYNKRWFIWGVLIIVAFIGLSICPYMLFGEGIISTMHRIFSRTMFLAMGLMIFEDALAETGWRKRVFLGFVCFGMLLVILSVTTQIFWDYAFIFELAWIYGYMLMLVIAAHE